VTMSRLAQSCSAPLRIVCETKEPQSNALAARNPCATNPAFLNRATANLAIVQS
jgi:hypothetical protein